MALALATALKLEARATQPYWHLVLIRVVAGVPLFATGMMHVFLPDAPMRPLVEAAGLPFASLLAPLAVGLEILAGASLLSGAWARLGALLAIPTMLVAVYAHIAIDAWPNPGGEPPLAVPLAVMTCAAWVFWKGAGRFSLDGRNTVSRAD